MPDENERRVERTRAAMMRHSVWQIVRAGVGRPMNDALNYEEGGPRFAGSSANGASLEERRTLTSRREITVASFNIDHGRAVVPAIDVLCGNEALQRSDVLLLQEMEEEGTARIAESLGMSYVYYPAGRHPITGRHFGNAILTRGDLVDDRKHHLPHVGRVRGTRRIAVAATIELNGVFLSAFSVHLSTMLDASHKAQREQLMHVIDLADRTEGIVVIGGDLNRQSLATLVEKRGYRWLTKGLGGTLGPLAVDHLFVRGEDGSVAHRAGVVRDTKGASDHRPVWSTFKLHE